MTADRGRGGRRPGVLRAAVAPALVAGVLALAGCTGGTPAPSGVIGTPPTPGSVTSTVPAVTAPAAAKYALTDEANIAGVVLHLDSVTAQDVTSTIPGEKSGPAVVIVLSLRNGTSGDYRTDQVETTLTDSVGGSATMVTGAAPAKSFPAVVAAGASATATYVYLVAKDHRTPITFTVSLGGGIQPAAFTGNV